MQTYNNKQLIAELEAQYIVVTGKKDWNCLKFNKNVLCNFKNAHFKTKILRKKKHKGFEKIPQRKL